MKRCALCGGRLGLISHRKGLLRFCKLAHKSARTLNASVSNKKPNSAENCGSIFLTAAPLKMVRFRRADIPAFFIAAILIGVSLYFPFQIPQLAKPLRLWARMAVHTARKGQLRVLHQEAAERFREATISSLSLAAGSGDLSRCSVTLIALVHATLSMAGTTPCILPITSCWGF